MLSYCADWNVLNAVSVQKPVGLFDVALTDKNGYFVGDVALRFWVREDGEGDTPPARGTLDLNSSFSNSERWLTS